MEDSDLEVVAAGFSLVKGMAYLRRLIWRQEAQDPTTV